MNDLLSGCYIILHIGTGPSASEEKTGSCLVVRDRLSRFELTDNIWIERLDEQLAIKILRACDPPNYSITKDEWDRHLYAFVRRVPEVEASKYEGMAQLAAAIVLSRLIHPTSIGDRYSVFVYYSGREDSPIQAIQYTGISADVFLGDKRRDWLSSENAEQLRGLMLWLSPDKRMHSRVHRAYWNHEYAMRSWYLDARWILVVSGLEALITVEENNLSWQFRDRVRQLAGEFNVNLTDDDLRRAYRLRS